MAPHFPKFWNALEETLLSLRNTEFLKETKGTFVYLTLTILFVISVVVVLFLILSGRFSDFASNWNYFAKQKRDKKDYEYLVGIVYSDKSTGKLYMTTRIEYNDKRIVGYRQIVIPPKNDGIRKSDGPMPYEPQGEECDGFVEVSDLEHMILNASYTKDKSS